MEELLFNPLFYLVAIPAVMVFGISKAGFGGIFGVLSVPIMSVIISPALAAAILLPLLIMMDVIVIYQYRRSFNRQYLFILIPFAAFGVLLGYFTVSTFSENDLRLLVGVIAVSFGVHSLYSARQSKATNSTNTSTAKISTIIDRFSGFIWGSISGFTSFHVHAGGPPASVYLLPKNMKPIIYAGTTGIYFSVINFIKLPAYLANGQITKETLLVSATLIPFVPISVAIGYRLVQKIEVSSYYTLISTVLILLGAQMIYVALV